MNGYHQRFQIKEGVLHVRLSGEFPDELLQKLENLFQPLIDACSEYHCKKVLIDARNLNVDFDTLTLFRSGKDAATLADIGLRVALLARKDMLDPFFDDVASNRSGHVCIFTHMGSALDWLKS
jgi:hypothetical protein